MPVPPPTSTSKRASASRRTLSARMRGDVLRPAGQGQREVARGGFVLHRGLDPFAVDEGHARIMAGGAIGAQPFDHFQDAGAVRRQADVIADIERRAGQEMLAGQIGQVQPALGVRCQQAERAQRRQQHDRRALGQAQLAGRVPAASSAAVPAGRTG